MSGPLKKYSFINAKLRGRISKMLSEDDFLGVFRASSLEEVIHQLGETAYAFVEAVYHRTGDIRMVDLALLEHEIDQFSEIQRLVVQEVARVVSALSIYYEIDILKRVLRLWFDKTIRGRITGERAAYLYRKKIVHNLPIEAILTTESMDELISILKGTPYVAVIQEVKDRVEARQSLFPIEIGLDRYFYRQLLLELDKLKGRDRQVSRRLIGVEIDIQNVSWIVRYRSVSSFSDEESLDYIIPQGLSVDRRSVQQAYASKQTKEVLATLLKRRYSGALSLLTSGSSRSQILLMETILEQIRFQEIGSVLGAYPFTIGIILAYFFLKRNEVRRICTVLYGKSYDIPADRIRSLL